MTSPAAQNDIQIDHVSSAAICEEIGDRLCINLPRESDRLPQHMMMLVEKNAQNECVSAVQKRNRSKPIKPAQIAADQLAMLRPSQNAEVEK
jgi:hypothetical protein